MESGQQAKRINLSLFWRAFRKVDVGALNSISVNLRRIHENKSRRREHRQWIQRFMMRNDMNACDCIAPIA